MTRNYPEGLKPYGVTITVKHFSVIAAESFAKAEAAAKLLGGILAQASPGNILMNEAFVSAIPDQQRAAHHLATGAGLVKLEMPLPPAPAAPTPKGKEEPRVT